MGEGGGGVVYLQIDLFPEETLAFVFANRLSRSVKMCLKK
jgi:hypothetical protein